MVRAHTQIKPTAIDDCLEVCDLDLNGYSNSKMDYAYKWIGSRFQNLNDYEPVAALEATIPHYSADRE
jgi:hypothetical protein